MKYFAIYTLLCLSAFSSYAQNLRDARKILDTLTSPAMWGRGYTRGGMERAADFIAEKFHHYGLVPMVKVGPSDQPIATAYKQGFSMAVNTFPSNMTVKVNAELLRPGHDFIVAPESRGQTAAARLEQKDSVTYINAEHRIILELKKKLTWSVAMEMADYTLIEVNKGIFSGSAPAYLDVDIQNDFVEDFKANNVCGLVRGTLRPDSLIVITAHYDHLGGMGDHTYFPGANDNASGVSLLLSLARHYAANPAPYSIAFICFAAEEAGILGSKYFTEHPLIDLKRIRFLLNVDLVGTGETGITVVNATLHPQEFTLLNNINEEKKYLVKINSRGKAANSDHYFFTEKGVPAFFIYTQGGIGAYHDVYDQASTLPLTEFEDLYKLFIDFNQILMTR